MQELVALVSAGPIREELFVDGDDIRVFVGLPHSVGSVLGIDGARGTTDLGRRRYRPRAAGRGGFR